jgi:two-component system, chemotaxis family, CheB/CheR fusion protein
MMEQEGQEPSKEKPPIVAVGASAGGVQALSTFISALPEDTDAAFVIIIHLDPDKRSDLPRILGTRTQLPVIQVEGRQKLEANHVYVIPPDCRLELVDHEISAVQFEAPRGPRATIDLFFRSLADRLGDGFAVILSGAGSDGAIGVRAVKEAGGIILVQEPREAEYGSMPRSAIATGVVDFVLPLRELVLRLVDLLRQKQSAAPPAEQELDEELVRRILAHLRVRTGHDFSKYKQSTVLRRIGRRMQVNRTDSLRAYDSFLRESPDEVQALLGDLLISVTTFFRDGDAFNAVSNTVLPALFMEKGAAEPIRIWVCGCATGEEAYTVAMLTLEEAAKHELRPAIQIFGSDLDSRALALAREGRFPTAIEADVSEERLRRFFVREGDHYRIRQEVRDIVLFAMHDVLKDPPFSHVDLISCRNVLIYLDRDIQEQVCTTFHYALNPAGFLLVGSSETVDQPAGLFRCIDRGARLYQSTTKVGDRPRLVPRLLGPARIREPTIPLVRGLSPTAALNEAALHRRAIESAAPPSVLVDEAHRILHLSDNAGRYLSPSGGPLTGDLVEMVRPELRFELRSALHRVFEQNSPTLSLAIPVSFNGNRHRVHLFVRPASDSGALQALVMFIEGEVIEESALAAEPKPSDVTVKRLHEELDITQARLRTVREESDAANEELRAANEELQSINEEYRSTSEELETSKEELQSINEELQTVNSELKLKLETISRAHSDLQNLMAATDYGTLFLDSNLRIKRFTDRVTDLFSLTPSDEGRSITDFANQLQYEDLVKDARRVLDDLTPIRREVKSQSGGWFDVRLRPYRTVEDKIDGVVLTFADISERRKVEEALRENQRILLQQKRLIDLSRDPIFVWDFERGIMDWNRGCEQLYGYSREEVLGKRKELLLQTGVPGSSFDALKAALLRDGNWSGELTQKAKDGRPLTVKSQLQLEEMDGRRLVLESTHDVTGQRASDRRQKLLLSELVHRVKNTLAVVQSLAHQTARATDSLDDFMGRFDGRLTALAAAHGLLVQSEWTGADFASLARTQLEPYISENPDRLRMEGEPIALPADMATPFGLVLHELATNASKYGSLVDAKGTVHLSWRLESRNGERLMKVTWREKDGPPIKTPKRKGFGSVLIESGIPGAKVNRNFLPDGLVCTIELPLAESSAHGEISTS